MSTLLNYLRGRNQILSSAILLMAGAVTSAVSHWYIVWLLARFSGGDPTHLVGQYALLLAIATPIFTLFQFGLRSVFLTLQTSVAWLIYLAVCLGGQIGGTFLLICVMAVIRFPFGLPLVLALISMKLTNALKDLYLGRIHRDGKLVQLGIATNAGAALTVLLATTLVILLSMSPIAGVFAISISSLLVISWVNSMSAPEESVTMSWQLINDSVRSIMSAGWPISISQTLSTSATYLPTLILGWYGTQHQVGLWAVISYVITLANILGASIHTLVLPRLRHVRESRSGASVAQFCARTSLSTLLLTIPIAVFLTTIGATIIELIYGDDFTVDTIPLALLGCALIFTVPAFVYSSGLLVLNRYGLQMKVIGLSLSTSFIVSITLIQLLNVSPISAVAWGVVFGTVGRCVGMGVSVHLSEATPEVEQA